MSSPRSEIRRAGALALLGSVVCFWVAAPARAQSCLGDCNGDNAVTVNEIVTCVNIDLGNAQLSSCPVCSSDGSMVTIADLIKAVNNALDNCGLAPATPTPGGTPCPLQPGKYTITSLEGGTLTTSTLAPFPFPEGGTIIADVGPGNADCVHNVVVPAPGGFVSPVFCVPALGYTVSVTQTGCGIGQIDSNGGSDYTVLEEGDSSYNSSSCQIAEPGCREGHGPAPDSSILNRVQVGDGTTDTCATPGGANALLSIPVHTVTWLAQKANGDTNGCPDMDMTFGPTDLLVVQFDQILDFTTDQNTADFKDLDGDGCSLTGAGPRGGPGTAFSPTGTCIDLSKLGTGQAAQTAVASGPIGSSGSPLYDLLFTTTLVNKFDGPEPSINATCDNPPAINFTGTVDRCIVGP